MFWLVCIVMTLATLALIMSPILRPPTEDVGQSEVSLYKAQLAEVDRDVARQVVSDADADGVRTEIARRLLAASRSEVRSAGLGPAAPMVATFAAICIGIVAGSVYWTVGTPGMSDLPLQMRIAQSAETRASRPSQRAAEADARVLTPPDVPEDYLASVDELRRLVPTRGDDVQGWELLAYHEARLRNFAAAADAQGRVVEIKGVTATPDDLLRHADLLVAAADGYVSPEAEDVVRLLLDRAPNSVAARYYLGAMFDQTDRPDLAFSLWRSIVESGAPESLYSNLALQQVAGAAFRAGINYTMPPTAPQVAVDLPGPTEDQMAAAADMADEDRTAMIENMVSGLAERLATEGGTAAEWARLIRAYGVLGNTDKAQAIYAEAQTVFEGSPEALALILDAGHSLQPAK